MNQMEKNFKEEENQKKQELNNVIFFRDKLYFDIKK